MSEHTADKQKPLALPDSIKLTQAVDMIEDLSLEARFLVKQLRELNSQVKSIIQRIDRLRLMLGTKEVKP